MINTPMRHLIRYPNARTSTVVYLQKRQEMTERLRQELGMQKSRKPWWKRLYASLRAIS